MESGLGDEVPPEAPDTSAQAAMPAEAGGDPPQRMDEDWYREMQFHYDASLQQGYAASETEDWLQQGYPALMEGFLSWYQVPSSPSPQSCVQLPILRSPTILTGFCPISALTMPSWSADAGSAAVQATKDGPAQGHAAQAGNNATGNVQSEGHDPASEVAEPKPTKISGASLNSDTEAPLQHEGIQEDDQPLPAYQEGAHSQPGGALVPDEQFCPASLV